MEGRRQVERLEHKMNAAGYIETKQKKKEFHRILELLSLPSEKEMKITVGKIQENSRSEKEKRHKLSRSYKVSRQQRVLSTMYRMKQKKEEE